MTRPADPLPDWHRYGHLSYVKHGEGPVKALYIRRFGAVPGFAGGRGRSPGSLSAAGRVAGAALLGRPIGAPSVQPLRGAPGVTRDLKERRGEPPCDGLRSVPGFEAG